MDLSPWTKMASTTLQMAVTVSGEIASSSAPSCHFKFIQPQSDMTIYFESCFDDAPQLPTQLPLHLSTAPRHPWIGLRRLYLGVTSPILLDHRDFRGSANA